MSDLIRLSQQQTMPPFPINSEVPLNNDYKVSIVVGVDVGV